MTARRALTALALAAVLTGALLLVVGYFAPAPPRRNLAAKDSTVEDSHQNGVVMATGVLLTLGFNQWIKN